MDIDVTRIWLVSGYELLVAAVNLSESQTVLSGPDHLIACDPTIMPARCLFDFEIRFE